MLLFLLPRRFLIHNNFKSCLDYKRLRELLYSPILKRIYIIRTKSSIIAGKLSTLRGRYWRFINNLAYCQSVGVLSSFRVNQNCHYLSELEVAFATCRRSRKRLDSRYPTSPFSHLTHTPLSYTQQNTQAQYFT